MDLQKPYPLTRTGGDALASRGFSDIAGLRAGFVGNHTSMLSNGTPTHVALLRSEKVKLEKLFSPEHGAFGREDHEEIGDDQDPATGLPIFSLYGANRKPTPEMLNGLDALIFEIQDVGARFYTYASTMLLCLEAAHEAKIQFIVLDRPNPITGSHFDGPLADRGLLSFVACHTVPVRHGLTLGELATLVAAERGFADTLKVVKMEGWARHMWFDETGIPWVSPSPAMRSLDTAIVYPGVCLLEQTNMSVGRGTDAPFMIIGAPWIDSARWASSINSIQLANVEVAAHSFTPEFSKFEGELCQGVRVRVTDRDQFASVDFGFALIATLRDTHGADFEVAGIAKLLANAEIMEAIQDGLPYESLRQLSKNSRRHWRERIASILLYS